MSLQNMLKQLLTTAQQHVQSTNDAPQKQSEQGGFSLKNFAGGAASGSVLTLLLSNKKFRKLGGRAAMYGGVAAIGALAYKAYGDWKKNENTGPTAIPDEVDSRLVSLNESGLQHQSRLILAALVAAAKADGHISAEEQNLLDAEFNQFEVTDEDKQWLNAQLARPADPAAIAQLATTPEEKAEVYLVSLLITSADTFMEKAYLEELAQQLQLEPSLKSHLEQTALQAAQ